jgi:hypothetical protein
MEEHTHASHRSVDPGRTGARAGTAGGTQRPHPCRRTDAAAAAITADGRVSREERMLYNHALARWRINSHQVSEAIRRDPMH